MTWAAKLRAPGPVDPRQRNVMTPKDPLSADIDRFASLAGQTPPERPGVRTQVTRDRRIIRRWADKHQAEPATGEATPSGPAKIAVNDGGTGIRFNFPGFGPFRPITWAEWFGPFSTGKTFYLCSKNRIPLRLRRAPTNSRAHALVNLGTIERLGSAERDLRQRAGGQSPSIRYRIVKDNPEAGR